MKNESETREKLIESARAEFMEKGYQGASLRQICKNAGVTTGALYFFFRDKEDLFASIVDPAVERLQQLLTQHTRQELMELQQMPGSREDNMQDDYYASRQIIHLLYADYDVFQLLLTKSQGSRYAYCVDKFVALLQESYRLLADAQAQVLEVEPPDDYTIHWVSHIQIDAFVHLLLHEPDEEKASHYLVQVLKYLVAGWMALFQK